jgi:hypothetical protein
MVVVVSGGVVVVDVCPGIGATGRSSIPGLVGTGADELVELSAREVDVTETPRGADPAGSAVTARASVALGPDVR